MNTKTKDELKRIKKLIEVYQDSQEDEKTTKETENKYSITLQNLKNTNNQINLQIKITKFIS